MTFLEHDFFSFQSFKRDETNTMYKNVLILVNVVTTKCLRTSQFLNSIEEDKSAKMSFYVRENYAFATSLKCFTLLLYFFH